MRAYQLEKQQTTIFSDIDMIKKHIEDMDLLISEFSAYEKVYQEKNLDFKQILMKENSIIIKRAETNKDIQFLQKQIFDLENEIKHIQEIEKKLNHMRELEFWLNNKFIELVLYTEKNVMLKLREEFSQLFSEWFSILVPDSINVRLDESFSPIIQQNDYELEYNYLSGGERTAVALAYRLALNQVINSLLIKIQIRDVLNQLKVKQLILVSHEQKIEGFVDNILHFKKIDGITEVEK